MLVYNNDFRKLRWKKEDLESAACVLKTIQNFVQQNGVTFFVAVIVPDKTSAYSDYLDNNKYKNISMIKHFDAPELNLIKLHDVIKSHIQAGEIDVYLPNDTHWGVAGHRIAANNIMEYFINNGILIK